MRNIIIAIVALVVVVGGIWWLLSSTEEPEVEPQVTVEEPLPAPAPPPVADVSPPPRTPETPAPPPLPPLEESDPVVREAVEQAAEEGAADLEPWLEQGDLVSRFATIIDNAAEGEYPWRQLGFLAPRERFSVKSEGEALLVDPAGYQRFDGFVERVVSVPPDQAAVLLQRFEPLIEEALAKLGEGKQDAIRTVHAAIDQALATPVIEGEIELVQPNVFYEYADEKLESLPPLQKQLLRMGPENVKRLQEYLSEVKRHLPG